MWINRDLQLMNTVFHWIQLLYDYVGDVASGTTYTSVTGIVDDYFWIYTFVVLQTSTGSKRSKNIFKDDRKEIFVWVERTKISFIISNIIDKEYNNVTLPYSKPLFYINDLLGGLLCLMIKYVTAVKF